MLHLVPSLTAVYNHWTLIKLVVLYHNSILMHIWFTYMIGSICSMLQYAARIMLNYADRVGILNATNILIGSVFSMLQYIDRVGILNATIY